MHSCQISISARAGVTAPRALRASLLAALRLLGIRQAQWDILITRDDEMNALHERHLREDSTTDVLTFDLREKRSATREGSPILLETVVCHDEARRRARELGHAIFSELLLYCIHSLLHVQGYDDRTMAKARRMHAREDQLLQALGYGPVYSGIPENTRKRDPR